MYLCLVWASPASKTQLIFKSSSPYFSPSAFIFCIFWYFSVFVWPNMGQPFKKQKKLRCQGAPLRVLRKWPRPVVETIGPNSLDLNNPKLGSRVSVVESLHRWRRPCWYPCIPWSMWKMSIANYRLIMTDRMFLVYRFGYSKLHQVHPKTQRVLLGHAQVNVPVPRIGAASSRESALKHWLGSLDESCLYT